MKPIDYVNIRPDFTEAFEALKAGTATPDQQRKMKFVIESQQTDLEIHCNATDHHRREFQRLTGLSR